MDDQENVRKYCYHEKPDPLSCTAAGSGGTMYTEPCVIRRGGKKGGCSKEGKEGGRGFGERRRQTANYVQILSSSLNAERHSMGARSLPLPPDSSTGSDLLEKLSSLLYIMRGPKLLEYIESTQRLKSRLFKPTLPTPDPSLPIHHVG